MMKKINLLAKLFGIFILLSALQPALAKITLHTIGDSTMATHAETDEIHGWGQMFQQFFNPDSVTVNNRSKSGASSKSFYQESAYWKTVKTQIHAGDYVLIQFAHNDEKTGGLDGDTLKALYTACGKTTQADATDYRGTTASETYKEYLRKYINETRALGATPILATSMCRNYWTGTKIRNNGMHNLYESHSVWDASTNDIKTESLSTDNHLYDYPYATKEVGEEMNVPVLDITTLSKELYESYGQVNTTKLLFASSDGTHPNSLGGTMIARLAAQEMTRQNILANCIQADASLLVNPVSLDFGQAYLSQTVTKEMTVSAFDLTPANGNITVTCPEGFVASTDKNGSYSQSINLSYTDGNLSCATVYIRCTFTNVGDYQGNIMVSAGENQKTIAVNANCVQAVQGTPVLAQWELAENTDCVLTGPATVVDETFSEMVVQRYASPNANAIWPEGSGFTASQKTQRNYIDTEGGAWPADEIDEVSTRYIQFGLKANEGTELHIDSIGFYICGAGGNGMRCHIYYQVEKETAVPMNAANGTNFGQSMVANTLYEVSATPVLTLSENQTLYVRIYPWYNGAATGKTICLSHMTIRGAVSSANDIHTTHKNNQPVSVSYFSADGKRLSSPVKGLNIVSQTAENGNVTTEKVWVTE